MNRWVPLAANIVLFDALWTLAVFGAANPWWWVPPVLIMASAACQLRWSPAPGAESLVIIVGAAAGVLLDFVANALGMFQFTSPSRTQFIIVFASLWINFGTTLRPSLRWLWGRPVLAAFFGGVGGPLAYWIAARCGAIAPIAPAWRGVVWCSVQYAVVLPVWCAVASIAIKNVDQSDRPGKVNALPRQPGTQES